MEAADPIAVALDAPSATARLLEQRRLLQEAMVELSQVFSELPDDLRHELDRALAGELTVLQIVALGAKLAWRLTPDAIGVLIARLIFTSGERPIDGGFGTPELDIDLDALERGASSFVALAGTGPSIEMGDVL